MTYNEFKNKAQQWPLIFSRDITRHEPDKQAIRNQLKRWREKNLLIKLKRGVFLLNANDRKFTPSREYIANQLYSPSYVSLEYALNRYGLIPERVSDVTSITNKKTKYFRNEIGNFTYQHIKAKAFNGFKSLKDEAGFVFFIAEPEKAVVDFCYLNLANFQGNYKMIFENSYRLQNIDILNVKKIMNFAKLFNNIKLISVSRSLCELIKKEKKRK